MGQGFFVGPVIRRGRVTPTAAGSPPLWPAWRNIIKREGVSGKLSRHQRDTYSHQLRKYSGSMTLLLSLVYWSLGTASQFPEASPLYLKAGPQRVEPKFFGSSHCETISFPLRLGGFSLFPSFFEMRNLGSGRRHTLLEVNLSLTGALWSVEAGRTTVLQPSPAVSMQWECWLGKYCTSVARFVVLRGLLVTMPKKGLMICLLGVSKRSFQRRPRCSHYNSEANFSLDSHVLVQEIVNKEND